MPDVPAGMLCDNGSPEGCNYMQCGPGRSSARVARNESHPPPLFFPFLFLFQTFEGQHSFEIKTV